MNGGVTFVPVILARGIEDRHARLAFHDGELALILVRLDHEAHEELKGRWVIEFGFGRFDAFPGPVFEDLEAVERWMSDRAVPVADTRSRRLS